jgi:hypothetical protein
MCDGRGIPGTNWGPALAASGGPPFQGTHTGNLLCNECHLARHRCFDRDSRSTWLASLKRTKRRQRQFTRFGLDEQGLALVKRHSKHLDQLRQSSEPAAGRHLSLALAPFLTHHSTHWPTPWLSFVMTPRQEDEKRQYRQAGKTLLPSPVTTVSETPTIPGKV